MKKLRMRNTNNGFIEMSTNFPNTIFYQIYKKNTLRKFGYTDIALKFYHRL